MVFTALPLRWVTVDFTRHLAYETNEWPMEGTVLARTSLLRNCYPVNITRFTPNRATGEIGEDTVCISRILSQAQLATLHAPHLYLYVVHGNNTSSARHFKSMARAAAGTSSATSTTRTVLSAGRYKRLLAMVASSTQHGTGEPSLLQRLSDDQGWLAPSSLCAGSGESVPLTRAYLRKALRHVPGSHKKR